MEQKNININFLEDVKQNKFYIFSEFEAEVNIDFELEESLMDIISSIYNEEKPLLTGITSSLIDR